MNTQGNSWRALAVAATAVAATLGAPASPAAAEGATFTDPRNECCGPPTRDITGYSLALNSEVVVSRITFQQFDLLRLQTDDIWSELDTDGDGEADYTLLKYAGGEAAVLLQGEFGDEIEGCTVRAGFDAGTRSVELSTTAACVGTPQQVRVSNYTFNDDGSEYDFAPGYDVFSSPVRTDPPRFAVYGAIGAKWEQLGGARGFLGQPLTSEAGSVGDGRYNLFQGGAIYWTPDTDAHEVHGGIRSTWQALGAEYSPLGYPTTDELPTGIQPGAVNLFQGGSVYWSPTTGAHEVYGAIATAWGTQGYEGGRLGFPTTGEFDVPGGRKSEFQGGNIVWDATTGATAIAYR